MKTTEDLKAAFAGESQANRKYLAWAKQADREGHKEIARLFRAVAAAETIHAHSHFRSIATNCCLRTSEKIHLHALNIRFYKCNCPAVQK